MKAWAEDQGIEDSMVTFMGDPSGGFTDALDMKMKYPEGPSSVGVIGRCKRFALHVVDAEIKLVKTAETPEDPAGDNSPEATCAPAMLEAILSVKDEL
mmetsp:Transcript_40370/g.59319  ORF Transcript_40370/g.59319 Transcript_40370/m.59319 type:complete len:98 (-) Transcript_40370:315-608(-)